MNSTADFQKGINVRITFWNAKLKTETAEGHVEFVDKNWVKLIGKAPIHKYNIKKFQLLPAAH